MKPTAKNTSKMLEIIEIMKKPDDNKEDEGTYESIIPKNENTKKVVISEIPPEKNTDYVVGEFISKLKSDPVFEIYMKTIEEKEEKLRKFLSDGKSITAEHESELIVLRQWNSYTPILPNGAIQNKGGGYLLIHNGKGIVIDPGYNFIEHFFNAGFKIDDIDYIFITHAHDDHTGQLEAIFSLLFKKNKDIDRTKQTPIHKIKLYLNIGTFKKFSPILDISSEKSNIERLYILNKHQEYNVDDKIMVYTTGVQHNEVMTNDYALGLTFKLLENESDYKVIRFTGDTGWNDAIEKSNVEFLSGHYCDKQNILVLHLGSIHKSELDYDLSKSLQGNENKLYQNHLGLIGVTAMIHRYQAEISIISEFGLELDVVRNKIVELLNTEFGKNTTIAADVNLRVRLKDGFIRSTKTHEYHNIEEIETYRKKTGELVYISKNDYSPTQKISDNFVEELDVFYAKAP